VRQRRVANRPPVTSAVLTMFVASAINRLLLLQRHPHDAIKSRGSAKGENGNY
jgi:hypothetical protein